MLVAPVKRQECRFPAGRAALLRGRPAREAPVEQCGRNKLRPSPFEFDALEGEMLNYAA